jgi:hypothetical protein
LAGTDPLDPDSDDDTIWDGHEGTGDVDGDNTINALDDDSDGDGISDADEAGDADPSTPPDNHDSDGLADFLDLDSDQDGLPDELETVCPTLSRDGRIYADTDEDGFSDLAEDSVGSDPCNASDGVTDYVEFFFELPYNDPEQTDTLTFNPQVQQADVFFNMDTTASMGDEISNLQTGLSSIIDETSARVSDAAFGVGAFDDFPAGGFGDPTYGDVPFALHQGITTNNTTVTNAVNGLTTHFGEDFPESGYEALYQIANGSGIVGTAGNFGPFTTTGRIGGAQFRPGSLPIVLHITDAPSHQSTDYPVGYGAHSKAQALNALTNIGARVITVQSGTDTTLSSQTEEISDTTGAVVPVCAFKTDANTWRCGVNTCCDGTITSGGECILRYTIAADGTGLSSAATDGIDAIVKYTTFDLYNQPRDDGDGGTPDTSLFLNRVEALAYVAPPVEPEASCNPTPVPAQFNASAYNNGYVNFAVGSSSAAQQGAQLQFTVAAQNTTVTETESPQLFTTFIDIIDDTTGTVLDTQSVLIIVPARLPDGQ